MLVFIWRNYIDLSHLFSLHQAYSLRIQCKNKINQKTEKKKKQSKDNHVQHRESLFSHCFWIIYCIYTSICVYFCHGYKNKIRYCWWATIHTRWKQNTEKLYSPHWGQRYTRLFKKKWKKNQGRKFYRL